MSPDLTRRGLLVGAGASAATLALSTAAPATALEPRNVMLRRWSPSSFAQGTVAGVGLSNGALQLTTPYGTLSYTDPYGSRTTRTYDYGLWLSPWVSTGFAANEIIPSWQGTTPTGTYLQVWVRARTTSGAQTRWFSLGRWASYWGGITSTSVPGQSDTYAAVSVDTLTARTGHAFASWQVRVDLMRPRGWTSSPRVWGLGAMASQVPTSRPVSSPTTIGRGRRLAVPAYSQQLHRGHYPQWGGGGEAWCSATTTAMLLDYWHEGPSTSESAWVSPTPHTDPQVDYVARRVFDAAYDGTGNWPFNTALAAARGLDAFVTRLRSLSEAQLFIAAGIPLGISVSFADGELSGAGYGTDGHLMVLTGFTSDAQGVYVNDPASHLVASNSQVPVIYRRDQLETAWARSGGLTYVMRPWSVALPAAPLPQQRSW